MNRNDKAVFILATLFILSLLYLMAVSPQNATDHTPAPDPTPVQGRAAWDDMDAAQLSWVIEGIQERMSDLADDLHYAQHLQRQKYLEDSGAQ